MEACCFILLCPIFIWIIVALSHSASENQKQEELHVQREANRKELLNNETETKINDFENKYSTKKASVLNHKECINKKIVAFLAHTENSYAYCHDTLNYVHYKGMINDVQTMRDINNEIRTYANRIAYEKDIYLHLKDRAKKINFSEEIHSIEISTIQETKELLNKFSEFAKKIGAFPKSMMLDDGFYGKVNKAFWNEVTQITHQGAVMYINRCEKLLNSTNFEQIFDIDLREVLKCVWFFATERTFSASDFQRAKRVFHRIYRESHADINIAELYAKKKMGGEDVLRDILQEMLNPASNKTTEEMKMMLVRDPEKVTRLASALMWMNAYQCENMVLQHMLTNGMTMTVKAQERLHSLTNGGGKAPSGFEVKSKADKLYFDVSALAWRDEEYVGLFENLAFQDKVLTYSLALREENKDLFIPQGIQVPDAAKMLLKFKSVFAEEYGSGVTARTVNCVALSGNGEEKLDGILAVSSDCNQMGILIHVARIGKKLIIKFYTLFTPSGSDLATQKQQALSMYKKLSPTVTMWEGSLKDTMLMAVEQLLNSAAQSGPTHTPAPEPQTNPDETVF